MSILKNIREEKGLTQAEVSKISGLSLRTIQRLEATNTEPKGHSLKMMAETFTMSTADLQEKFFFIQQIEKADLFAIKSINLSVLAVLVIPFGNLILPIYLWNRKRYLKKANEMGKKIINFQILWSIVLCFSLVISPFVSRTFLGNTSIILIVLFLMYFFNVIIVLLNSQKLSRKNFLFIKSPISFL